MVKALFLGLLAATMCGFAAPAPQPDLPSCREDPPPPQPPPLEDPAARSERSTNLSHVTGINRKIQMYIKNRHLQLLPDGTVNGTTDDNSPYTIFQRTTVGIGQLKIQGVTTCQYLCMNYCGLLYGSREFENDECTFNENIEPHNYNTYTSTKYSNGRRTLYLALNRRGQPRRVLLRAHQPQGNVTTYIRVLTRAVSQERLDNLLHPVRHHTRCSSTTLQSKGRLPTLTTDRPTDPSRCGRRRKRKKKRRKCQTANGENDTELCHKRRTTSNHRKLQPNRLVKKCENENSDECQRDVTVKKKKQKTNIGDNKLLSGPKKKKNAKKGGKKRHQVITSTEVATTAADDVTHDEDYGLDSTTHWEWEDSTAIPDMSMSISMSMPGAPTSAQPD